MRRGGLAAIILIPGLFLSSCHRETKPVAADPPERIVALSPGLSETVAALGCRERLVGVSRFSSFPPEVGDLPRVGGYLDPNFEAILRLAPDMVFVMESQDAVSRRLKKMQIPVNRIDQHNLKAALASFEEIGVSCGEAERGRALREQCSLELEKIRAEVEHLSRPSVLIVVGRNAFVPVRRVWVAGKGSLFDDILEIAGAENALKSSAGGNYPEIGREGILSLNPDIILDLIPAEDESKEDSRRLMEDWNGVGPLRALKDGRIYILQQPWLAIPGPRVVKTAQIFARLFHAEGFGS